jgi:type VI secretion system secreted protein VgrG
MVAASRQISLAIDLGGEQIQIERAEVIESLGRPFVISLDLFATLGEIDLLPHLGKAATISVYEDDFFMRYFHGIVVEGEYLSERTEGFHYRIVMRPWTFLLSQNRDFAIFQEMTTLDIIKKVLSTSQFADVDYAHATSPQRQRPYCVQYGESDFAFISRLLEEDGYYYYFEHAKDKHTLVLCDSPQSHAAGKAASLEFNPTARSIRNSGSDLRFESSSLFVDRWNERVATTAETKVTLRDFDFEKPKQPLEKVSTAKEDHDLDALEIFDWPGRFLVDQDGERLSKVMLGARRASRQTYTGESQQMSLACGTTFTLTKHPTGRFNHGYLITRTHHLLSAEAQRTGGGGGNQIVHFEAVPDDVEWQAPQLSPRPVVRGPETAIVTGPKGEEIYTDEYGRVKVRFHWDRSSTEGDKSTCWIRVSQTGGLGNVILPRVGHEVIIDFLDGNPDRPVVVGRVFNKENMPIYPLPDNKTRALWRTKRYGDAGSYGAAKSLDTGAPGANELRFEDKGGKEEVFLHAERDMTLRVRHSESHNIGLDQSIDIGGSRDVKIQETDSNDVGKSIKISAGTTIEVEAQTSITFKVGQTSIVLDQTSVTLKTTMLKMEAQATADVKSPMTTVKGDGMLTLKGGITMIN